jgi:hypothetical protein
MLDAEDQKRMYENLDWILGAIEEQSNVDGLIDTLTALTGLEDDGHGVAVLDPSTRDDANRVLVRWLRDHGRLPKRTRN